MAYKTLEVELDNGRVYPRGTDTLPASGHALLTLLDSGAARPAGSCGELAERWSDLDRLPAVEASAFADDIEQSRAALPPAKSAWD